GDEDRGAKLSALPLAEPALGHQARRAGLQQTFIDWLIGQNPSILFFHNMKGFAEPVRAWRLRGLWPTPVGERPPFVGRQSELRLFRAALSACRESGRGQAIYIRGEAGFTSARD